MVGMTRKMAPAIDLEGKSVKKVLQCDFGHTCRPLTACVKCSAGEGGRIFSRKSSTSSGFPFPFTLALLAMIYASF